MMLKLVEEDKLLKPFAGIIEKRHQQVLAMRVAVTAKDSGLIRRKIGFFRLAALAAVQ